MRKIPSFILMIILAITAISSTACSSVGAPYSSGKGEIKVVCTVFPIFDIARNIGGDHVSVTLLQDSGADMHSYTPTASALKAVGEADIFVYIGGASDSKWAEKMISSCENENLKIIRLADSAGDLIEPETSCSGDHDHGHTSEKNFDEHIWTSPKKALLIAKSISEALCELSEENQNYFESQCAGYIEKLSALEEKYRNIFENAKADQLVFADRFPFAYLLNDYSFAYTAAFGGCSTETDASYETLEKISQAVTQNELKYIITIDGSDGKLAASVKEHTGCGILTVNSLQSATRAQIDSGLTYIGVMEENLSIFKLALEN